MTALFGRKNKVLNLLEETGNAPMSVQVARFLIGEIKRGVYKPGEKLDSIRRLAGMLGVGRQVVLSAFEILSRQNYICCEVGRGGSYVNPGLNPGLYYRVGLFFNRSNPARYGRFIHDAYSEAVRRGWQLAVGGNFEENFEVSEWLGRKADLDGVIMTGVLDEAVMRSVDEACLHCLVAGRHDISPRRPQLCVDFSTILAPRLADVLRRNRADGLVSLVGPAVHPNEKALASAIKQACLDSGMGKGGCKIIHCHDGGYADICAIMRAGPPPALFFWGEHVLAWKKYLSLNKTSGRRPFVIVSDSLVGSVEGEFYDAVVDAYYPIGRESVGRLVDMIQCGGGGR